MVIDVLEKMVPFAQEWELNSMFHPGWIMVEEATDID